MQHCSTYMYLIACVIAWLNKDLFPTNSFMYTMGELNAVVYQILIPDPLLNTLSEDYKGYLKHM